MNIFGHASNKPPVCPSKSPVLSSEIQESLGLAAPSNVIPIAHDLNARRRKYNIDSKPLSPEKRKIGEHYLPRHTCNLQVLIPFRPKHKTMNLFANSGLSSSSLLLSDFNWRDEDLVAKHRFNGMKPTIKIMDPPNQYSCGSCWAVSSASVLTDRYRLLQENKFRNLVQHIYFHVIS